MIKKPISIILPRLIQVLMILRAAFVMTVKQVEEKFLLMGMWNSYPFGRYLSYLKVNNNYKYFISSMVDNIIPKTLADAQCDLKWMKAMKEEMTALEKIKCGMWLRFQKELTLLDVSESILSNIDLMGR